MSTNDNVNFNVRIVDDCLELALADEPSVSIRIPRHAARKLGFQLMSLAEQDHLQSGLLSRPSAVELAEPDLEIGIDEQGRVALAFSQKRLAPVHVMLSDDQARQVTDGIGKMLAMVRTKVGAKPN
jgi:hypothetical protein